MTKDFFKGICKYIRSNIAEAIPNDSIFSIYRGKEGQTLIIECAGFKYTRLPDGRERIQTPEGLDDD